MESCQVLNFGEGQPVSVAKCKMVGNMQYRF
jgi:hypothetical protein